MRLWTRGDFCLLPFKRDPALLLLLPLCGISPFFLLLLSLHSCLSLLKIGLWVDLNLLSEPENCSLWVIFLCWQQQALLLHVHKNLHVFLVVLRPGDDAFFVQHSYPLLRRDNIF